MVGSRFALRYLLKGLHKTGSVWVAICVKGRVSTHTEQLLGRYLRVRCTPRVRCVGVEAEVGSVGGKIQVYSMCLGYMYVGPAPQSIHFPFGSRAAGTGSGREVLTLSLPQACRDVIYWLGTFDHIKNPAK